MTVAFTDNSCKDRKLSYNHGSSTKKKKKKYSHTVYSYTYSPVQMKTDYKHGSSILLDIIHSMHLHVSLWLSVTDHKIHIIIREIIMPNIIIFLFFFNYKVAVVFASLDLGIFIILHLNNENKNRYCLINKTSTLTNPGPLEVDKEYLVMCADKWQIALSLTKLPSFT